MRFEWDEAKRRSNVAKHGIDFRHALLVFDGWLRLDIGSIRGEEERTASIAILGDKFIAVV